MPSRKPLGGNLGQAGGMMAALGFPRPSPAAPAAEPEGEAELASSPRPASPARRPPAPPPPVAEAPRPPTAVAAAEAPEKASPTIARIATDLSAEVLLLAKRGAYWNRETLRSFLERAIEAEAGRIAREQGLTALPDAPPLRRGRPLRA